MLLVSHRYFHSCDSPFKFDPNHYYIQFRDPSTKPNGLWYSITGGMTHWLDTEFVHFYPMDYSDHAEIVFKDRSRIKVLHTQEDTKRFVREFGKRPGDQIYWSCVRQRYAGVELLHWSAGRKQEYGNWYWAWDCCSGCIWDLSIIESITETTEHEVRGNQTSQRTTEN